MGMKAFFWLSLPMTLFLAYQFTHGIFLLLPIFGFLFVTSLFGVLIGGYLHKPLEPNIKQEKPLTFNNSDFKAKDISYNKARILLLYILANILFFLIDPFSSPWHYHDHEPVPISVIETGDDALTVKEITRILDEIDLAYKGREHTSVEQAKLLAMNVVGMVLFPATFALHMKEFVGYIGPANSKQQAFTLSVKQRYNYLAWLARSKGMERNGYLFLENISLSKQNGEPFNALRTDVPYKPTLKKSQKTSTHTCQDVHKCYCYQKKKQYKKALDSCMDEASRGYAGAQYDVAQLYRTGKAGIQDKTKAVEYYKLAAEQDFGEAQFSLGIMYFQGSGTAVDMEKARYWWEKSENNGIASTRVNKALNRIPKE